MTEETRIPEPLAPDAHSHSSDPAVIALTRSVRRLRTWMIVLSVLVGLVTLMACGSFAVFGATFGLGAMNSDDLPEEAVTGVRQELEDAYGDRVERLEVRPVEITYGEVPFPYSMMSFDSGENGLYVECRLKGTDVLVANVIGAYGQDASSSGMMPTKGPLASRMNDAQFDRLLAAYGKETDKPFGGVRRYNDTSSAMMEGESVPDTVTVGDKRYASQELWRVTEGVIVKGDTFDAIPAEGMPLQRDALVFHEDPATGVMTFLGTEPAEEIW